jgi:hypothetical protein
MRLFLCIPDARWKEEGIGKLAPHLIFWIVRIILFQKEKKR